MIQIIKNLNAGGVRTEELAKKTEENLNKNLRLESQEPCKTMIKYEDIFILRTAVILKDIVKKSSQYFYASLVLT